MPYWRDSFRRSANQRASSIARDDRCHDDTRALAIANRESSNSASDNHATARTPFIVSRPANACAASLTEDWTVATPSRLTVGEGVTGFGCGQLDVGPAFVARFVVAGAAIDSNGRSTLAATEITGTFQAGTTAARTGSVSTPATALAQIRWRVAADARRNTRVASQAASSSTVARIANANKPMRSEFVQSVAFPKSVGISDPPSLHPRSTSRGDSARPRSCRCRIVAMRPPRLPWNRRRTFGRDVASL